MTICFTRLKMSLFNNLNSIDYNLLMQIHSVTQNSFLDSVMPYVSAMGDMGAIWILFSLILLANKKYRMVGIMCLAALLLTTTIGEGILKNLLQRPRPFVLYPSIQPIIPKPPSFSFPSGHTASSFAAAWVLSRNLKKAGLTAFTLAAAIAFSRLYLMVHYPSDILGGILLGTVCAICAEVLFKKYWTLKGLKQI
jgi:undecaprenyl-diphosphatase